MNKKRLCIALCLLLVLGAGLPVRAVENTSLKIQTAEEFLAFAQNCRMDSYSKGLTVSLETDIDLTDLAFTPIPIFCGTFEGGGHRITGLQLSGAGSMQGLFRYLTQDAVVRDLIVQGQVIPQGSRDSVGGLAGSNAGTVENCVFVGTVSGSDSVGGLVGINTVTGIIDHCCTEGSVYGNHFAGGLAGENYGVIRSSENMACVNTTAQQNSVELSDVTIDTLTNSEAAGTVTDIGGIAGTNGGIIRSCKNEADVGYRQMGYNIGGIAGSSTGYITGCRNSGKIAGRKEVGGIVGQMEPAIQLNFAQDALQQLQQQMDDLSAMTANAAANAQTGSQEITGQLEDMEGHLKTATDAIEQLLQSSGGTIPDPDSLLAAQNALSSALQGMTDTMGQAAETAQNTATTLSKDMQAVVGQMNVMGNTINSASENLGGSLLDVSDSDTEDHITGKVSHCVNYADVQADLNAGGIAGAMSLENDLDPEDDLRSSGNSSLNFETQLRAVVRSCVNHGQVLTRKQCAGGIVGWQSMGLVYGCENSGQAEGDTADYVGGIVGRSSGYIRSSSAKCLVSGSVCVGGIAGEATVVTDCRSMVRIQGSEKLGAVAGAVQSGDSENIEIAGNFYLPVGEDPGAMDGISYAGQAQPLDREKFLALEGISSMFDRVSVRFITEEGTVKTAYIRLGSTLRPGQIPAVPEKEGCVGAWDGLEEVLAAGIEFDISFTAKYITKSAVIQSDQLRSSGRPVLLAQGDYLPGQTVAVQPLYVLPQPLPEGAGRYMDGWSIQLPENIQATALRYCLPEGCSPENVQLLVYGANEVWEPVTVTVSGSYLIFSCPEGLQAICLVELPRSNIPVLLAAGAVLVILGIAVALGIRKGRKKKTKDLEKTQ